MAGATQATLTDEQCEAIIRFKNPQDIPRSLESIARAVASGRLDHRLGNAVVVAASTAIRAADTAELAKRIELIEAAIGRKAKKR